MKIILFSLLILLPFFCLAQTNSDSIHSRINILIEKNNSNLISKEEKKELLNYGYKIQNRGFMLEEYQHDYLNALNPIDSAISFWISINEPIQVANLRKYKGYLLGNLNRFSEGKQEIHRAIYSLKQAKRYDVLAVSQYDMSLLLDRNNELDSALYYQKEATAFWYSKQDTSRILVNNTHLIQLYRKLKEYKKAEDIQGKNEMMLSADEHWNPTINFYFVSYNLYNETKQFEKANAYKKLYIDKLEALKKDGIYIKSIYDID